LDTKDSQNMIASALREIQTPLDRIINMNRLILETAVASEQREYAEMVRDSAEMISALIEDVDKYLRIETGGLNMTKVEFDCWNVIDDAVDKIYKEAVARGVGIYLMLDESVPEMALGDAALIGRAVAGLVVNGAAMAVKDEVRISVAGTEAEDGRIDVVIELVVNNVKISEDEFGRLFKPFGIRGERFSWLPGASGLGLAVCRKLTKIIGGDVNVSRKESKELQFCMSFPVQRAASKIFDDTPCSFALENMKVLVADSVQSERAILVRYLEAAGCSCVEFGRLEEAFDKLSKSDDGIGKFDVMIAAVSELDDTGLQSTFRARIAAYQADTPLLLISNESTQNAQTITADNAIVVQFGRPVRKRELLEWVSNVRHSGKKRSGVSDGDQGGPLIVNVTQTPAIKKTRILVAEDNSVNRKVVAKFLETAGYEFDLAENGLVATEMCKKTGYDIIFMDCEMPVKNGYDAARSIRALEIERGGSKRSVICAMTGNSSKGDRKECFEAGMDDFISKPLNRNEFITMVDKWSRTISA